MTAFRDQLDLDESIFLNEEEFGESLTIDGVVCTVVQDANLADKRARGQQDIEGVFTSRLVLHLRSDALAARPVEGQRLALGTGASIRHWYCRHVSEAEGMMEIALERQET